jgi:hypothetical protein
MIHEIDKLKKNAWHVEMRKDCEVRRMERKEAKGGRFDEFGVTLEWKRA